MRTRNPERKLSTTVYLTPEQLDKLHELCAKTSIPMASMIRDGVDKAIADAETKLDAQEIGLRKLCHEDSVDDD